MFRIVAELDRLGIPLKDKPFFRNTGDFGLYAAYPHRKHRAFREGEEGRVRREQIAWLEAEGGTALKVGEDVVLIRDPQAAEVRSGRYATTGHAAVFRP